MIHIIGGGTVSHIRPHLAICAPAYGGTAKDLKHRCSYHWDNIQCHLTRMAGGQLLETNDDIAALIKVLVAQEKTRVIFMTAALCDYTGNIVENGFATSSITPSGKGQPRLKTEQGTKQLVLTPAEKIISTIRKTRKDIFLVGFKTTAGASEDEQFIAGLGLLKKASCNLVLANDVHTRTNMIITPEQARYYVTRDRDLVMSKLVAMTKARSELTFTRSTVKPGNTVPWDSEMIPQTLRTVVDHCITNNAYKPFLGSTVGHFAAKIADGRFVTSIRKSNFNDLHKTGLVLVETEGDDSVVAYGAKPSVGGQSQRIVFSKYPQLDCIVHFHCQPRSDSPIARRSQEHLECGSHACGQNTADGLTQYGNLFAVMLNNHGPNIVFSRDIDPQEVIKFIDENFDLSKSTDGINRDIQLSWPSQETNSL